jgi:hypothetical protein
MTAMTVLHNGADGGQTDTNGDRAGATRSDSQFTFQSYDYCSSRSSTLPSSAAGLLDSGRLIDLEETGDEVDILLFSKIFPEYEIFIVSSTKRLYTQRLFNKTSP